MGFSIRGFIWDIPILIFAYVLFWGPNKIVNSRYLKGSLFGTLRPKYLLYIYIYMGTWSLWGVDQKSSSARHKKNNPEGPDGGLQGSGSRV